MVMTFDWRIFLERWSHEWLTSAHIAVESLPSEVVASGWVGYPGATETQIAQAEGRLGARLPASYRTFLAVSNGWQATNFSDGLWPIERVEWLSRHDPDFIDIWTEHAEPVEDELYYVYGEEQNTVYFRAEYLRAALQISDSSGDAVYLLNPRVVTPDGEWEAWFFANWYPGASRYHSFQELMQAEYETFLRFRK